jgi:hypothetical protein
VGSDEEIRILIQGIENRLKKIEDKILIHGDILQRILEILRIQTSKENHKKGGETK